MFKPLSSYLHPNNNHSQSLSKVTPQKRKLTSRSLSQSILSDRSSTTRTNGVKLPSSFYNDRRKIYLKQSRALSEKSLSYQSKEISFSERKKYTQDKV